MTPFLTFVKNSDISSAKLLIKRGANVNHRSKNGWNVLIPHTKNLNLSNLQLFLEECNKESKKPIDINLTDNDGRNLLHHAQNFSGDSINVNFDVQRYLIEQGIDVNCKDNN